MDDSTNSTVFASTIGLATTSTLTNYTFPDAGVDETGNWATIVKAFVLSLIAIIGTIGNVLVVVTIAKNSKLWIPGNYFLINLTISDLIITAISIPVIIKNVIRDSQIGNNEYGDQVIQHSRFCFTSAYLKIIALHVSWYSLAFIALNRYYSICRRHQYADNFTKRRVLVAVCLVWLWVILINIPIIAGWAIPNGKKLEDNSTEGYYLFYPRDGPPVIYDHSSHDCVLGVNNQGGYTYANGFFAMSIPLVAIIFCYSLVYMEMVQGRRKVVGFINVKQMQKRYRRERKLSIMLTIVVLVFMVCWVPAISYDFASSINKKGEGVDYIRLVFNWLALSNSAMNPGLYAILSKTFRRGYKTVVISILRSIICCGRFKNFMDNKLKDISSESGSRTTTLRSMIPRVLAKKRSHHNSDITTSQMNSSFSTSEVITSGQSKNKKARCQSPAALTLTVPREQYRIGRKFRPATDDNTNENESKIETVYERDDTKVSQDCEASTTTPTKKRFTPLLEQLDNSKDLFSEGGIYMGVASGNKFSTILRHENDALKLSDESSTEGELN